MDPDANVPVEKNVVLVGAGQDSSTLRRAGDETNERVYNG